MIHEDDLGLPDWDADVVPLLTRRPWTLLERFMATPPPVPTFATAADARQFYEREAAGEFDGLIDPASLARSDAAIERANAEADVEEVTATVARVEVVFARYGTLYWDVRDDITDALSYIAWSEDYGEMAALGILVDGEPHLVDCFVAPRPPTAEEAAELRTQRARAREYEGG